MTITCCPVCQSQELTVLTELPEYPITERYADEPHADLREDQSLLNCDSCGHVFLQSQLPASILYDSTYKTVSAVESSKVALQSFANFIFTCRPGIRSHYVADIGGNDGTLGCVLGLTADQYFVVDPVASRLSGAFGLYAESPRSVVESAGDRRTSIVSSHTIEHLHNLHQFFESLVSASPKEIDIFLQFPSLEGLVSGRRWFQISHQHLHYFSLSSIAHIATLYGFTIQKYAFDRLHYGALQVWLDRQPSSVEEVGVEKLSSKDITDSIEIFQNECEALIAQIMNEGENFSAYGAGLMFPVLAYHLPPLREVRVIYDDDPSKWGKRYSGTAGVIDSPELLGQQSQSILVTGVFSESTYRRLVAKVISEYGWLDKEQVCPRKIILPWREL